MNALNDTNHNQPDDLAVARNVLRIEAEALQSLSASLNGAFVEAVGLLAEASAAGGRIVISGMGKSGHIARKIAATMASTGTPALFVHPAEASHGDLGMIVQGDAVLAISNSGETAELADLVAHTRRFGLKLVAIVGREISTLGDAADVALILPNAPEASPVGPAPTTSTTMQLALGDAIAVALLTRHGFESADFRMFHPGGKLGAKLRRVRELMHSGEELPLVDEKVSMRDALLTMTARRFGCVGVTDAAGTLAGVVTDGDLRRAMGPDLLDRHAADVMTHSPRTIAPETLAAEALRIMNAPERPVTALFVVGADGLPVGILHIHDLLRAGVA
ncbi:MAG: KpsF/GutQ family sugar-phosphate isomerase [Acetobacteraceae bacterium]|nr:KpsF/GutQ family sugar-phosphate isomerase [Acetobacteraceae bacterium]